ncbi:MAG TPA: MBL fold metallo-hydrolase [Balneolaceae bacterium]|nr:MBL fold metallo-hydrolase [Balneolaceae bacterium]|tara:strand:- start:304159 stop:304797 length:639 start_codon:yes stop_codon:yes gene_type:complete
MNIHKFVVGPFQENTYLLTSDSNSIIIDPGFYNESEYSVFAKTLAASDTTLKAVVLTHAHVDHVLGLQRLMKDYDIPVYLNHSDLFLWENFGSQATMFGLNQVQFGFDTEPLPADDEFNVAGFDFTCLYTPGHAPDHTSLYFKEEQVVISGDALFRESIGRTDLYKGDFELLKESILKKLYTLPEETIVYPGHGEKTTIGYEKQHNPFVKAE